MRNDAETDSRTYRSSNVLVE